MLDLGKIKPDSTLRIPWGAYAASTGASSTVTNYSEATILIYKDGVATKRASLAGLTATPTFDSLTGINLVVIDLADNSTPGFFAAGSEYFVVIGPVTVDAQTVYFPIARFSIEIDRAVLDTSIEAMVSQASLALTKVDAIEAYMRDAFAQVCIAIDDIKRKMDALRDPAKESALLGATDAISAALGKLNNLSEADLRKAVEFIAAKIPTAAEIAAALGKPNESALKELLLVKAKTDLLTFGKDGALNVNVQRIGDTEISHGKGGTAFATIQDADIEAKARVLAGKYLQAYGCLDERGFIAIRFLTASGAWDSTTE